MTRFQRRPAVHRRDAVPTRSAGSALTVARVGALALAFAACGEEAVPADAGPQQRAGSGWSLVSADAPPVGARLTAEQQLVMDELNATGYAGFVAEAPAGSSVTVHDAERALEGLNFYVSGHAPEAQLIDMQGRVLHTWSHDYDAGMWAGMNVPDGTQGKTKWRRAYLFPNGDVLAMHARIGLMRLDRDSNVLWTSPGHWHHAVEVMPDGRMWTLGHDARIIPRIDPELPSMDDEIVELDPRGSVLRRISVLECLENGGQEELLARVELRDMFHTNSLQILEGRIADRLPAFRAGNVLISMRHLDALAVVDVEARKVVWSMTGDFKWQHDAKVLDDGNIMLFDNQGRENASTVYEFDPVTGEEVWAYRGTPERPFYSETCGTAHRLENGNTLIAESDGGRSIEVTPGGEIVWEYYNPHRGGDDLRYIACIYDLVRVDPDQLGWLEREAPDR